MLPGAALELVSHEGRGVRLIYRKYSSRILAMDETKISDIAFHNIFEYLIVLSSLFRFPFECAGSCSNVFLYNAQYFVSLLILSNSLPILSYFPFYFKLFTFYFTLF